jgi:hypothetical protein
VVRRCGEGVLAGWRAVGRLQEQDSLAALQDAFTSCPEDVLRRIAEGSPRFADWRTVDLLNGP